MKKCDHPPGVLLHFTEGDWCSVCGAVWLYATKKWMYQRYSTVEKDEGHLEDICPKCGSKHFEMHKGIWNCVTCEWEKEQK